MAADAARTGRAQRRGRSATRTRRSLSATAPCISAAPTSSPAARARGGGVSTEPPSTCPRRRSTPPVALRRRAPAPRASRHHTTTLPDAGLIWRCMRSLNVTSSNVVPLPTQPLSRSAASSPSSPPAVEGLGDLIDDYEFHYPQELSPDNLDVVREALDGHGIYCVASGLHLDTLGSRRAGFRFTGRRNARGGIAADARGDRPRGRHRRADDHLARIEGYNCASRWRECSTARWSGQRANRPTGQQANTLFTKICPCCRRWKEVVGRRWGSTPVLPRCRCSRKPAATRSGQSSLRAVHAATSCSTRERRGRTSDGRPIASARSRRRCAIARASDRSSRGDPRSATLPMPSCAHLRARPPLRRRRRCRTSAS